jgi:hypothetical protein
VDGKGKTITRREPQGVAVLALGYALLAPSGVQIGRLTSAEVGASEEAFWKNSREAAIKAATEVQEE